jgi:hypothetical protein
MKLILLSLFLLTACSTQKKPLWVLETCNRDACNVLEHFRTENECLFITDMIVHVSRAQGLKPEYAIFCKVSVHDE